MKKRFILLAVLMILVGALPASAGQIARSNGNISASTSKWALEAVGLGTTTLNNQSFYLIPTNSFRGKANASQFVYFNLNNTGTSTLSGFTMEATQGGAVSQQVQITFERCTTEWDQINDICSGSTSTLGAAATNPNVSVSGLMTPKTPNAWRAENLRLLWHLLMISGYCEIRSTWNYRGQSRPHGQCRPRPSLLLEFSAQLRIRIRRRLLLQRPAL